jgi:hypothetical protein
MRKTFLASVVILCTLLAVTSPGKAAMVAAQTSWAAPAEVSDGSGSDWFPDIAVSDDGTVYVIWGSGIQRNSGWTGDETGDDLLRYREQRGQVWSPINDINYTCVGGYTVRNSIVVGHDDRLHVLVRRCFMLSSFSAPADNAWSAQSWSEPLMLGTSYYNALATDSSGTLHALYNEAVYGTQGADGYGSEIMYRRSTDNGQTWSVRRDLAELSGGDERMQIKTDGQDRLHVVWDHGSDWYTGLYNPQFGVYRRSEDGGLTWSDQVRLGIANEPVFQTALGLTLEGDPLVVYRSAKNENIYFQTSPDGGNTWSAPAVVPGISARPALESTLDRYSLATDSANRIHLLAAGFPTASQNRSARPLLLHLVWDGQSWSPPEVVMAGVDYPFWPTLIAANGNQLHAVWFNYSVQGGWGHRSVWYSTRSLDTPFVAPPPAAATPLTGAAAQATPAVATTAGPDQTPAPQAPLNPQARRAVPPPAAVDREWLAPLILGVGPVAVLLAAFVWLASRWKHRDPS